jgi:hypothetical protein
MIGTNLPQKRSEHGASLLLLVSIVGLAFIVTVAAMLVAASNGQDTARLASAKVDVANREDVLMREILRETATGMLNTTPETWTTIMTNATTNNRLVTDYVDQAELTALGITGKVTSANTGDTGNGNPLDIFQGYTGAAHSADAPWSEVPLGGTSGLAGCVPSLAVDPNTNQVIDPPLMNWSGNLTLSSTNATTTPQEFFLGSLYASGPPTQSSGNRWTQLTYPAIRFGYKQPNDKFIARRVWWRIPLVYNTTQQTVEDQKVPPVYRYKSFPANYVLSVYEIPSQLPISGNANLGIGLNDDGSTWGTGISVAGSIYGGKIQLNGKTYNGVSSQQQVNIAAPTTVGPNGGVVYTDSNFDQPGTQSDQREGMAFQNPTHFPPGVAAPVSVATNNGKVLLVPVLPVNNLTGKLDPTGFYMQAPGNTPTHWDLYARPYYKCRIRVIISGTDSNLIPIQPPPNYTAAGKITVTIYVVPDPANPAQPDQILGFPDPAPLASPSQTSISDQNGIASLASYGMAYTSTPTGDRNILVIDVPQMVNALAQALGSDPAQLYSIYIGNPPNAPDPPSGPYNNPGIAITDTHDLSTYTTYINNKIVTKTFLFSNGLSIVTNQTLYLLDAFNQGAKQPPTSIYAPEVRYGISGINSQVNLGPLPGVPGQVAVVATPAPSPSPAVNPLSFKNSNGSIPSNNITARLNEVIDPRPWSPTSQTGLPPITALSLLFIIEKEQIH